MAEILSYNHYRDMHNDVQLSAMFFGKNIQNIPFFSSTQTAVKEFDSYGLKVFTFTGKERDSETGFSYFGARYYDSDLMMGWLSVDPMADKYPSLSPYAYCAWNPVNSTDPNGMDTIRTPNGIANVGEGYKATPDGKYLYGEGLQTKYWNPDLEIGGIIGEELRGGYENCDNTEIPIINNTENTLAVGVPVAVSIGSMLSDIVIEATTIIEATAIRFIGILGGSLLLSGDTRQTKEMSQHGRKNIKLSPEEVKRCKDILNNPKSNKKEKTRAKQKLKTHEKSEGIRQSRQSKDKKTKK